MNGFLISVLTGLLATIAVTSVTWFSRRLRDSRVTRQYPIAGIYASSFEDSVDGITNYTKASAIIQQRGQHIWGETTTLDGGRKWILDGQLSKNGRVYGTYKAEDPHDTGEGGFFLEIAPKGRLDGVWAGFDSRNKTVTAGRYQFWPKKASYIRPMEAADIPHSLAILGEELGRRYISRDDLEKFIENETKVAFVAVRDGNVAGAVTGQVLTHKEFLEALPTDMQERVELMIPYFPFGVWWSFELI